MTLVLGSKGCEQKEDNFMSKNKHNYTQYAKKNDVIEVAPEVTEVVESVDVMQMSVTEEQAVIPEMVEETVKTVTLPELVTGTVVNCAKLNVREHPDIASAALCVLNAASELEINVSESTSEWFRVITATGVEGYGMRKFISANL